MTQKILVFGGNKFLGKRLLEEASQCYPAAEIFALTRSGVRSQANVTSLQVDRADSAALREALKTLEFDLVFDVSAYQLADLKPSLDLLKGRVASWVMVSSAGVYAKSPVLPLQADFPKVQTAPHNGKLQCEEALRGTAGLHTFCVRPLYIYGPENTFEREAYFFKAIKNEAEILVPGDGNALLQFADVSEVAGLILQLSRLPKEQTQHGVFHTAHKSLYSINTILEICAEIVGKKAKIRYFNAETASRAGVSAREVFPLRAEHYFADLEPLHRLGLRCHKDLKAGLSETYAWFKANRDFYPKESQNQASKKLLSYL